MTAVLQDGCALECRGVTYRLPSGTALVSGLNLIVAQGETVVCSAAAVRRKTTTLKLINRLLEPNEGEIFISGRTASSWDPIQLRRGIGYVIQDAGLFPHWSVEKTSRWCRNWTLAGRPDSCASEGDARVGRSSSC